MHFFEKYVSIKIENQKILVLMSKLSPKLDEVNASYPCKYINSVLWDFHVIFRISSIYYIITQFFKKYVRVKIEDHKILVLMSKLSPKLDEINVSYPCKYKSQSCETFMYFINFTSYEGCSKSKVPYFLSFF